MKPLCSLILLSSMAFAQTEDAGTRLLAGAKEALQAKHTPAAQLLLRQSVAYWQPLDPKPPQYLEAVSLLGIVLENRLYQTPDQLPAELDPLLQPLVDQFMMPGKTTSDPMAAMVLEVYALMLERTGRESEVKPLLARARQIRFPALNSQSGQPPMRSYRPTPPASAGGAARIENGDPVPKVSPPSLLHKVEPDYTMEARVALHQGTVVLAVVVAADGIARDIRVIRNLGFGLDEKAIEAVEQWRFRPGQKEGEPVPVQATIEVNFRLL